MPKIESRLNTRSEDFETNRAALLEKIEEEILNMQSDLELDGPFVKTIVGLGRGCYVPVANIVQASELSDKSTALKLVLRVLSGDNSGSQPGGAGQYPNIQADDQPGGQAMSATSAPVIELNLNSMLSFSI